MKGLKDIDNLRKIQKELREFDEMMEMVRQYPTKLMKNSPSPRYEIR